MLFLMPKQQCQSTEGKAMLNQVLLKLLTTAGFCKQSFTTTLGKRRTSITYIISIPITFVKLLLDNNYTYILLASIC